MVYFRRTLTNDAAPLLQKFISTEHYLHGTSRIGEAGGIPGGPSLATKACFRMNRGASKY